MVLAMGLKSLRIKKKIKKRQKLAIQFANFGYEDKYASQSVRTPKVGHEPQQMEVSNKIFGISTEKQQKLVCIIF